MRDQENKMIDLSKCTEYELMKELLKRFAKKSAEMRSNPQQYNEKFVAAMTQMVTALYDMIPFF